jgi:hypothetical protein
VVGYRTKLVLCESILSPIFLPQPAHPQQTLMTRWLYQHLGTFHDSKNSMNLFNLVKHFNKSDEGLAFLSVSSLVSLPFDHAEFLISMAKVNLELDDFWGAKVLILTAYLIYQSMIIDAKDIFAIVNNCFESDEVDEVQLSHQLPWCHEGYKTTASPEIMKNHLEQLVLSELKDAVASAEPTIALTVMKDGHSEQLRVNSLVNLNTALKLFGNNDKSLRLKHNGARVFFSSAGRKTLCQLGMKDDDILEIEDSYSVPIQTVFRPSKMDDTKENTAATSNRRKKKNKKKTLRGRN